MVRKIKRWVKWKDISGVPLWCLEFIPFDYLKTRGDKVYACFIVEVLE